MLHDNTYLTILQQLELRTDAYKIIVLAQATRISYYYSRTATHFSSTALAILSKYLSKEL